MITARRLFGLVLALAGLALAGFAFAGSAAAWSATEDGSPSCVPGYAGNWVAHFTVHNDPTASFGPGTISGTGTALDGQVLSAGGGTASVDINEPHATSSVTVGGIVTWHTGEHAPFSHSEYIPQSCVVSTPTPTPTPTTTTPTPTPTHTHTPPPTSTVPVTTPVTHPVTHSTTPVAVTSSKPTLAETGTKTTAMVILAGLLLLGGFGMVCLGWPARRNH